MTPACRLVAVLVGLLLTLPSVFTGLAGGDWVHLAIINRVGALAFDDLPLLTLFRFMPGVTTTPT